MALNLTGIHHVTAVSADIRTNHSFYTKTLGMRLVKRTVNQDDPSAYHLFYADAVGSPGTDLTFFDFDAPRERRGTNAIVRTALRVSGAASLEWWKTHLDGRHVTTGEIVEVDGRLTLHVEDSEGQRLALIDDAGAGDAHAWDKSPIPAPQQIRGLGPVTLSVPNLAPTDRVLRDVMNMRAVRTYPHPENATHTVHVYEMGPGGAGAELHVAEQPDIPTTRNGAGGVHHVAFRTPDADYEAWARHLNDMRIANSGEVDRFWFRSLYFREPNGILFEIASDGPGFAVDESSDSLGETLVLAPFLEPRRASIVARLKPID